MQGRSLQGQVCKNLGAKAKQGHALIRDQQKDTALRAECIVERLRETLDQLLAWLRRAIAKFESASIIWGKGHHFQCLSLHFKDIEGRFDNVFMSGIVKEY